MRELEPNAVFLNVPYDPEFAPLVTAYIAALTAFGLVPKATLEIPGGAPEARQVAALAETYYTAVAPNHEGGPVATAAAHLAASLPNFFIQHIPWPTAGPDREMRRELVSQAVKTPQDGFLPLPTGVGLSINVNEKALKSTRTRPHEAAGIVWEERCWEGPMHAKPVPRTCAAAAFCHKPQPLPVPWSVCNRAPRSRA